MEKTFMQREQHLLKARGAKGMPELKDRENLDQEFTSVSLDF